MRKALLLALVTLAPLTAQLDRFGLPACSGPDRELSVKHAFIICHSADFKAPLWTIHELSPSAVAAPLPASTRRFRFRRDWSLSMPGASDADYRASGYSRGHLVPARDVAHGEQPLSDSFLLSNAVPQNDSMNRSEWRRLENWLRQAAARADSLLVVTGAIFGETPERIGAGGVAIPSALYKVILVHEAGRSRVLGVVMPNAESAQRSLDSFFVAVDELERRTGLKFFPGLEANR